MQRYAFPMAPGQTWNQWVDDFNEATRKAGQINRYVRVGGWETVATPAGSFEALRLRVFMRLDDEEFWRGPTPMQLPRLVRARGRCVRARGEVRRILGEGQPPRRRRRGARAEHADAAGVVQAGVVEDCATC